jgi:NAD(P)-dependent dehydrogenase (short-subunit alcohol dehydrogenase family)
MRLQAPVNSGFGRHTPAAEVVAGLDLTGKTMIVTGGHSGIGVETVRALAGAGATVICASRDVARAAPALADMPAGKVELMAMDLADLASVRAFAEAMMAKHPVIDVLINNAGIMACPLERIGPQGWESQFAVCHIGHFVLTNALVPALLKAQAPRVVALSSTAHIRGDVLWDDIHFRTTEYNKWDAYAQAKSANALFALGLDMRLSGEGLRAFSVHPGGIFTPLQRHLSDEEMVALGWKNPDGTVPERVAAMFKTPEAGASTSVWAATSPRLAGLGGLYCEDCDVAQAATETSQRWEHVRPWVTDEASAERLWALTEAMLAA